MDHHMKAGTHVTFTSGEYSDYGICAHVVFRKDCDLEELMRDWVRHLRATPHEQRDKWFRADQGSFVAWLQSEQVVAPVDTREIHLGSYGEVGVGSVEVNCYDWEDLDDPNKVRGV